MLDDGSRLTMSLGVNKFFIMDALTGKSIIFNDGLCSCFTLDKQMALNKLKTLQEALNTFTPRKARYYHKVPIIGNSESLIIREDNHFCWTIGVEGKAAVVKDNVYLQTRGFDEGLVLRRLNSVYSLILNMDIMRDPKHDIVRRISDVGLLVWVYNGNSVAVYEKNVNGCCMSNCLVNGIYYDVILVGTSVKREQATLFTQDLEEIISFPLDDSILAYYPDGDKMYN